MNRSGWICHLHATSKYSATCLVSTLVSTHSWLIIHFTQSLAHVHYVCQPVLIASTSDKKHRFVVPFKVLTKQVYILKIHKKVREKNKHIFCYKTVFTATVSQAERSNKYTQAHTHTSQPCVYGHTHTARCKTSQHMASYRQTAVSISTHHIKQ